MDYGDPSTGSVIANSKYTPFTFGSKEDDGWIRKQLSWILDLKLISYFNNLLITNHS